MTKCAARNSGPAAAAALSEVLVDVMGGQVRVGSADAASRKQRLAKGPVRTLYHQTDVAAGQAIVSSQQFRSGSVGSFGGGIYFAGSVAHTDHKATRTGVVLSAEVRLGNTLHLTSPDPSITLASLIARGYDSVTASCFNGTEYVVYHHSQVSNIKVVRS